MDTHSQIQELANNSEIENSRNKSHPKIYQCTVIWLLIFIMKSILTVLISVRKPPGTSEGSSGFLWKNLKRRPAINNFRLSAYGQFDSLSGCLHQRSCNWSTINYPSLSVLCQASYTQNLNQYVLNLMHFAIILSSHKITHTAFCKVTVMH